MRIKVTLAVLALSATTSVAAASPPVCAQSCYNNAATAAGCASATDWNCLCNSQGFQSGSTRCVAQECSTSDAAAANQYISSSCQGIASSSIPASFTPPSGGPTLASLTINSASVTATVGEGSSDFSTSSASAPLNSTIIGTGSSALPKSTSSAHGSGVPILMVLVTVILVSWLGS